MTEIVTVQTVQTVRDLRRRWKPHKERLLAAAAGIVGAALLAGAAAAQDRPVAAVSTPAHHGNRLLPEDFHLLGGWRVAMPFCGGGLAIDSKNKRFFTNGFGSADEIMEFSLMQPNPKTGAVEEVKMGKGDNVAKWPRLDPVKKYTRFWEGGYAGGLFYEDNCLWVSPRKFYDTSPPLEFSLYGKDLTTGEVKTKLVKLPRAAFGGGFVKAKGGKLANTLLGCGGYESGQGSVAGPTLATADGKILINQKNHGTSEFSQRELRPANYWPKDHKNGWMALEPQNGVGRWACDRIHAGGIWTRAASAIGPCSAWATSTTSARARPSAPPPKPGSTPTTRKPMTRLNSTSGNTGTCRARKWARTASFTCWSATCGSPRSTRWIRSSWCLTSARRHPR